MIIIIFNDYNMNEKYINLINTLTENNYQCIIDKKQNLETIPIGIGDILFKLVNLQENIISKPIYINLDLFQSGKYKSNKTSQSLVWFDNPYNNFIFRINLLNDIIENSIYFEKKDFIFVITSFNAVILDKINIIFNYKLIKKFNLSIDDAFYTNTNLNEKIINFIKVPFIIFHTKLRLSQNYDYNKIKLDLYIFFSELKIQKYNIILLGEQKFKPTLESDYI